jgi:FtsH-binding integral membrane protein
MRKPILLAMLAVLVIPAAALAAKPPHPAHPATPSQQQLASPKVSYILKGTLSAFTAVNGSTAGSVTIVVTGGNAFGKAFKAVPTLPLTFAVNAATGVVLRKGATTIGAPVRGIVKVRGAKGLNAAQLQALVALQVIDQGPVH